MGGCFCVFVGVCREDLCVLEDVRVCVCRVDFSIYFFNNVF